MAHLVDVTATATPETSLDGRDELAPQRAAYWDIRDVQFHCRVGRSTAWRMVREEGFPAPVIYSKRCVMWPSAEVIAFLEDRRDSAHYSPPETATEGRPVRAEAQFASRPVRRRGTRTAPQGG